MTPKLLPFVLGKYLGKLLQVKCQDKCRWDLEKPSINMPYHLAITLPYEYETFMNEGYKIAEPADNTLKLKLEEKYQVFSQYSINYW